MVLGVIVNVLNLLEVSAFVQTLAKGADRRRRDPGDARRAARRSDRRRHDAVPAAQA